MMQPRRSPRVRSHFFVACALWCVGCGGASSGGGGADMAAPASADLAMPGATPDLATAATTDSASTPSILGTWKFSNMAGETQTLTLSGGEMAGGAMASLKNEAPMDCFDTLSGSGKFTFASGAPMGGNPTWTLTVTLESGMVSITDCKDPGDEKNPRAATAKELEPYGDLVSGKVTGFDGTKFTLEDKGLGNQREYKKM